MHAKDQRGYLIIGSISALLQGCCILIGFVSFELVCSSLELESKQNFASNVCDINS